MQPGTKLGRYEISCKIGAGGMGEVFLAHDHALDRDIALKILLPEFCLDEERVQRFQFEARAVSALNHPNIITIHEIDEFDERLFIATEFIDGVTLREKIEADEISMPDALKIAEQVAGALAIAHEAHIIHRDIKPENIMIRRDGYTKILDFGLAKPMLQTNAGNEDETIRLVKTQPGMVMGSVRYMSPEQARGKPTDERTDVWSLGVVLYEMLTGENPFDGETISDSLAALIHVEPPVIENVPEELQRIIRKTLKKNPEERYQSIKDFALDLKDLQTELLHISHSGGRNLTKTISVGAQHTSENQTLIHHTISDEMAAARSGDWAKSPNKSFKRRFLPLALAASVLIIFAGAFYYSGTLFANRPKFSQIQVTQLTNDGKAQRAAVAPDGKLAAFVNVQDGKQSLIVRQISAGSEVVIVPPTNFNFYKPTFTPDGEYVYYVLEDKGIGTLYKTPTLGVKSEKILVDIDSPVTFSPDGKTFAFIRHNPTEGGDTIYFADADGNNLRTFLQTKEVGYDNFRNLDWSPDGKKLLAGVFKGAIDEAQKMKIAVINIEDKNLEFPVESNWIKADELQWLADSDSFVFVGKHSLSDTMQVWMSNISDGKSRQITNDTSDYLSLGVSSDGGTMIAAKIDMISSFWSHVPGANEMKPIIGDSKSLVGGYGLSQMPDGRILYSKKANGNINIFSINENGTDEKQLTTEKSINFQPTASPDGRYIFFNSNRSGVPAIWRMNADGTNPVQMTNFPEGGDEQVEFAADGKTLIFTRRRNDGGSPKIMKVSIEGGEAVSLFSDDDKPKMSPKVAPDGKHLAFHTFSYDEKTAHFNAAVKIVGFENGQIIKSAEDTELALQPDFQWSPDGKSLMFINRQGIDNLWKISIENGKETAMTNFTSGSLRNFAWSQDKKKLLIVRSTNNSDLVLVKDTAEG